MINTASGGLGFLISNGIKNGSQGQVVAYQIIILVFGLISDYSINKFRKLIFKYSNF